MKEINIPNHIYITFFEESAVLLDSKKNIYYMFNDSAADFWKFLVKSGSLEETLKELTGLYECSPAMIIKDMEFLVERLIKSGLLETKINKI
ncbi:MAG: PqqD family protein [Komarekiella atlantica HA4396-MV6]|jgi:hypothetical protein|nr:PqqD family protein [Komarekiella atlantica HA4396-MV6]